jgi:cytochrome c biogenesis protein CcmG, thiol:disulfide interchange protein DsbE
MTTRCPPPASPQARRPARGRVAVLLAAVLVIAVSATGAGCSSADTGNVGSRVDDEAGTEGTRPERGPSLDSPTLRALRAETRLEPCTSLRRTVDMAANRPARGRSGDGRTLPDITLPCLGRGPDIHLPEMAAGRPVVLNLWAQWCPPCRKEAPHFQALHERAGDRLQVVGVDYDDPQPERALALAEELGLRYPQLADPDKRLKAGLGVPLAGIPATVFVATDGRIVHVSQNVYRSEESLARDVRTYLGVRT